MLAWTPSTNGPVKAPAYHLVLPEQPTKDELSAALDAVGARVKGHIVLVGRHEAVPVSFNEPTRRYDAAEMRSRFDPVSPTPAPRSRRNRSTAAVPGSLPEDGSRRPR